MSVSRDTVPVALVDFDPEQPRQHVDPARLAELATSIAQNGLAVPILLRPVGGRYVIVHGERRFRAVCSLGWTEVPAEVRDLDEDEVRWLQLVENLNRDDLSPMEEARAYRAMLGRGETQQSLAARLGKDRTVIAQKLRLLDLPAPLALLCDRRALSEGHVRQLLRIRGVYNGHTTGPIADDPDRLLEQWAGADDGLRGGLTLSLLVVARPEDWPPGYPFQPKTPVVHAAAEAMCREVARAGDSPRWLLPAFYFAALAVEAKLSVANLDRIVDGWIERIHSALLYTRDGLGKEMPHDVSHDTRVHVAARMRSLLWHCYRSDLRHAGLDQNNEHIKYEDVVKKALSEGAYAVPSECQPRGPEHDLYLELHAEMADRGYYDQGMS